MGYVYALGRLDEALGRASGPYRDLTLIRDRLFTAVIETLTWLEMLFDHDETKGLIDGALRKALSFARGRSRHAWAEAIEFRTDVPLTVDGQPVEPPIIIADWCWRRASDLPGDKRPGHKIGKAEYEKLFAGRRARDVLGAFMEVANRVSFGI